MTARIIDGKAISAKRRAARRRARRASSRPHGVDARAGGRHRRRGPGIAGLRAQQGQGLRGGRHLLRAASSCPPTTTQDELLALVARAQRARRHPRHPRAVPAARRTSTRTRSSRRSASRQGRRRLPSRERRAAARRQGHARAVHAARVSWCCSRRPASTSTARTSWSSGAATSSASPRRCSLLEQQRHRHDLPLAHARPARRTCARPTSSIVAVGRPEMVKGDWIKPGAVVIDVGINRTDDGRSSATSSSTRRSRSPRRSRPVPGGVGPMTIAMLLENTADRRGARRAALE